MTYKSIKMIFSLVQTQYQYERRSYTFVQLLADFGGFNDGLFLLTSSFMVVYSRSMFEGNFSEQFPVRRKSKKKAEQAQNRQLYDQLSKGQEYQLSAGDTKLLAQIAQRTSLFIKSSYLKSLCSPCLSCRCFRSRKDRQLHTMNQALEQYASACDIRSLINVMLNQSILLEALLTKEQ